MAVAFEHTPFLYLRNEKCRRSRRGNLVNKVRLPYIVQDQLTAIQKDMKPVEAFFHENDEDEVSLDGPVSNRLA